MRVACTVLLLCAVSSAPFVFAAQPEAAESPSLEARLQAATQAIEAAPDDAAAYSRRAALYAAAGRPKMAVADYDRVLALDPKRAEAYDARGSEQFKLGRIDESIADFDRFIERRPDQQPWHWKRGISYYYAGRYDEGRRQFEGYQTVDDNDVENAVWRFLCMAQEKGVAAARADMLKIKRDPRVPMMEVYALYSGRGQPDEVLRAAAAGSPDPEALNARLFYAHLYLGLYYDALGDKPRAKEHLAAATKHKISHYMWNVADVHLRRLNAEGDR